MTPALDRHPPLSLRTDLTGWQLLEPEQLLHRIARALAPRRTST